VSEPGDVPASAGCLSRVPGQVALDRGSERQREADAWSAPEQQAAVVWLVQHPMPPPHPPAPAKPGGISGFFHSVTSNVSHGFRTVTQDVGGVVSVVGRGARAAFGVIAAGCDIIGQAECGEFFGAASAASYYVAAAGDTIRGHYSQAVSEVGMGTLTVLTAGANTLVARAADEIKSSANVDRVALGMMAGLRGTNTAATLASGYALNHSYWDTSSPWWSP